jgi:multimeric flavodoxin WrbA
MKVIAVSGSPRKGWNTDILLNKALEGARSAGAEVELINLYDLNFKGCRSCMACSKKGGNSLGHCAFSDDLKPVLEKINRADGLILGSPIYWGDVTGEMRAFLERLLFQYTDFDNGQSLYKDRLKAGFIYTMNAPAGYFRELYEKYAGFLGMHFKYEGTVESAETMQVENYDSFHLGMFDAKQRQKRRETVFPQDCQNAFELGKSIAEGTGK